MERIAGSGEGHDKGERQGGERRDDRRGGGERRFDRDGGDRRGGGRDGGRPPFRDRDGGGDRRGGGRDGGRPPFRDRDGGGDRRGGGRPSFGGRDGGRDGGRPPSGNRGFGGGRPQDRDGGDRRDGGRPSFGGRDGGRPPFRDRDGGGDRRGGGRPSFGGRDGGRDGGRPSFGGRDGGRPSHGGDRRDSARPPRRDDRREGGFAPEQNGNPQWIYGEHAAMAVLNNESRDIACIFVTQEKFDGLSEATKETHGETIKVVESIYLDKLCKDGDKHQGIAIKAGSLKFDGNVEDLIKEKAEQERMFGFIFDKVQDPHNIGAIIRTAVAFGADFIIIPTHGSPEINSTIVRTSVGLSEIIPIFTCINVSKAVEELQALGFHSFALDGSAENTVKTGCFKTHNRAVFVVGSEGDGVRRLVKERCDDVLKIPMAANVDSLNVASAAAVIAYEYACGSHASVSDSASASAPAPASCEVKSEDAESCGVVAPAPKAVKKPRAKKAAAVESSEASDE